MTFLPREIIDHIARHLPLVSSTSVHRAIDIKPHPREATAFNLWTSIFKSEEWLDKIVDEFGAKPFLVGSNLDEITVPPDQRKNKTIFVLLHSADLSGDTRYETAGDRKTKDEEKLFFQCLRDGYQFKKRSNEIWFRDIGVVLNISEPLRGYEWVPLGTKRLKRLVKSQDGKLQSRYSFFTDKQVNLVESPQIIGIGGPIFKQKAIGPVLALNLVNSGTRLQFVFTRNERDGFSIASMEGTRRYANYSTIISSFRG